MAEGIRQARARQASAYGASTRLILRDTRGYSGYIGGGVVAVCFTPVTKHHSRHGHHTDHDVGSAVTYQQRQLHLSKHTLFRYRSEHGHLSGKHPGGEEPEAIEQVVGYARAYATVMHQMIAFGGME